MVDHIGYSGWRAPWLSRDVRLQPWLLVLPSKRTPVGRRRGSSEVIVTIVATLPLSSSRRRFVSRDLNKRLKMKGSAGLEVLEKIGPRVTAMSKLSSDLALLGDSALLFRPKTFEDVVSLQNEDFERTCIEGRTSMCSVGTRESCQTSRSLFQMYVDAQR